MERIDLSTSKKYIIEKEIYRNDDAHTRVLRASDELLGRTVILKEIGYNDDLQKKLILNEIRNLTLIEEYTDYIPYIYNVYDNKKKILIEMREIKGSSLREYIRESGESSKKDKFWYDERYTIYLQICKVLAEIHKKAGFIHKDIKPENIVINRKRKESYIIDFGISGPGFGKGVGTDTYMAPEQRNGYKENIGQQSDVFSLALVGIELFTGECPEFGKEFILNPVTKEWSTLPDINDIGGQWYPKLGGILLRAVSANPGERYPNAGKLYEALKNSRFKDGRKR